MSTGLDTPQYVSSTRGVVGQGRVFVSEWIKLRSLKSSWITLAVAVAVFIGLGLLFSWLTINKNGDPGGGPGRSDAVFDAAGTSLGGSYFAQLAIGVLGILFVTGEYSTGMIRSTLGAVPKRLPVLWAKAVVFGLVTLGLMEISSFAAFFIGQSALGARSTTISAPGVFRMVMGTGFNLAITAAFAIGLGFMIRSTGGGMAALFGFLLVLPIVDAFLPDSWQHNVAPYLPSGASRSFTSSFQGSNDLPPWTGFAVFCAWAAVALIGAAVTLKRRDA